MLGALIDRKADIEIVRRLDDQKASLEDLIDIKELINALNDRLKHIVVL